LYDNPKRKKSELTVINRYRLDAKKILMCEGKDTDHWFVHLITKSFIDSTKNTNQIPKSCIHDARNQFEISDEERIDRSHWSTGELFKCDWSIFFIEISDRIEQGLRTFFSLSNVLAVKYQVQSETNQ